MGTLHRRWLGFSRTRLFIAVLIPCLIGVSAAYRDGYFSLNSFALIAFGLVMVESSNLLLADWATFSGGAARGESPPPMPGSPMVPPSILPISRTIHASVACLALAALTMLFFAANVGVMILLLGAAAVAIGAFYAFSPIRYGFFSTALLPPLIALGTYLALSGTTPAWALYIGFPNMLLSAGCIFTYRILYEKSGSERYQFHARVLIGLYLMGFSILAGLVISSILPLGALLGLLALPLLLPLYWALKNESDYIPATSIGVTIYALSGLLIALGCALA